jgi:serine/threonine-protein kinase
MGRSAKSRDYPDEPLDYSGETLGDYYLLRKLGQGGMGQVYLAEQVSLRRKVALKLLRPDLAENKSAVARFRLEAEAVAKATHANIVQVYAYGEVDGLQYMALEYVEGRTLKDYINKKGPPELPIALSIMRQVAAALQRAAELGITHRDIKPENILLTRKGEVKVADFGLSRVLNEEERPALDLTQTGMTMGTPLYMSPEQVEGKPVDPRSDIYSFGVSCYHMLAGHPPFRGETAFEVALAHVQKEPEPLGKIRPDLPEGVCAIIHKMMAKQPEERYQTGRELLRDILRVRESLQSGALSGTMPSIQVDPSLLNTIIPPDESMPRAPRSRGSGTIVSETPLPVSTATPQPPAASRQSMLRLAVIASIFLSVMAGGLLAWRERENEGPLPLGEDLRPGDALASERVPRPSNRENALREAAEQYLIPFSTPGSDLRGGQGVCSDLGLFYLDAGRLDDALALFQRMERFRSPLEFHRLGQLGKAVVFAMQHKPKESAALLREVYPPRDTGSKGKGKDKLPLIIGIPPAKRAELQLAPIKNVLNHARWQYYLARTRYLNLINGLKDDDMPPLFVNEARRLESSGK